MVHVQGLPGTLKDPLLFDFRLLRSLNHDCCRECQSIPWPMGSPTESVWLNWAVWGVSISLCWTSNSSTEYTSTLWMLASSTTCKEGRVPHTGVPTMCTLTQGDDLCNQRSIHRDKHTWHRHKYKAVWGEHTQASKHRGHSKIPSNDLRRAEPGVWIQRTWTHRSGPVLDL